MAWDEATERNLLLAVIMLENTSTKNWDKVKEMIGATDLTPSAISQRFNKMKRECKMSVPAGGEGEATGTPKKTPAKRGRKAKGEEGEVPNSGKRKAKKDVEEDDVEESPVKKIKGEVAADGEEDEV